MSNSRVLFLEEQLFLLGMNDALRALDLMVKEMCSENGYSRHDGSHYYYHLVDVTQDLLNHGIRYEPCIVAALLHDYYEDVEGVTIKMIENLFTFEISFLVQVVSKHHLIDYKVEKNLQNYLDHIGDHQWAALIKTADRKHNFSTLRSASMDKRMRQAIETENYFIPRFKEWRKKYPRYAAFFYGAKTSIEPHLWAIKDYHREIEKLHSELDEANSLIYKWHS